MILDSLRPQCESVFEIDLEIDCFFWTCFGTFSRTLFFLKALRRSTTTPHHTYTTTTNTITVTPPPPPHPHTTQHTKVLGPSFFFKKKTFFLFNPEGGLGCGLTGMGWLNGIFLSFLCLICTQIWVCFQITELSVLDLTMQRSKPPFVSFFPLEVGMEWNGIKPGLGWLNGITHDVLILIVFGWLSLVWLVDLSYVSNDNVWKRIRTYLFDLTFRD